jgi:hypothetical protein
MTAPEVSRYRGYEIVPQRQWSSWCVGIYPTRADLPILPRSTLSTLAPPERRTQSPRLNTPSTAFSHDGSGRP